ncbi:MAG: hypothetical protein AB1512_24405 [Thermodesulfobacteriota bacterium]
MSKRIVTEEEVRRRLSKSGKTSEDIDKLIDGHIDATRSPTIDSGAVSDLLRKAEHESTLRVRGFKLTREQFDALASYFEDAKATPPGFEPEASYLVQRAVEEFIKLID